MVLRLGQMSCCTSPSPRASTPRRASRPSCGIVRLVDQVVPDHGAVADEGGEVDLAEPVDSSLPLGHAEGSVGILVVGLAARQHQHHLAAAGANLGELGDQLIRRDVPHGAVVTAAELAGGQGEQAHGYPTGKRGRQLRRGGCHERDAAIVADCRALVNWIRGGAGIGIERIITGSKAEQEGGDTTTRNRAIRRDNLKL